ncbi:MAG TPA: hypothetical protein VLL74_07275 [Methanoregula sp.]|nr:hypothetical protein [Methanoregula sp.]
MPDMIVRWTGNSKRIAMELTEMPVRHHVPDAMIVPTQGRTLYAFLSDTRRAA